MDIKITYKSSGRVPPKSSDMPFGTVFTDRMFTMKYEGDKGWHNPVIENFTNFSLSPAALVFHYAQEIFEGQKAYKWQDGRIAMFRPEMNVKRFNQSAGRMCMPQVDEELLMKALQMLVWEDRDWIPEEEGHSLYIRPAMIATDSAVGLRIGTQYTLFIINSPVGSYFPEGFNPVKIWVSDQYIRAIPGGTGEAKTGGNYGASLKAMAVAREKDCSQVLWLDGKERKYVEEVGSMNIFFVEDGKLITPKLTGSILQGITRDSVITVAESKGIEVEEKMISIDDICEGIISGKVTECFGSGTACVISPVGELYYKGKSFIVNNNKTGEIAQFLYDAITAIQYGRVEDRFGWIKIIEPPAK